MRLTGSFSSPPLAFRTLPVFVLLVLVVGLAGCSANQPGALGGDAEKGKLLLRQYGCSACHTIPGVAGPRGNVGPPLERLAKRVYLGGTLPNTPENLARFIQAPQEFDPRTAMPDMQVTDAHVRDMVAHLQTLK